MSPHLGCIIIESMESTTKILFKIYFVCQLPLYFHKTNWCWRWGPTWRSVMMEPGTVNCATIAPSTLQEFRITSKLNISNLTDTNATYVKNIVLQKMLLNATFIDIIIKFINQQTNNLQSYACPPLHSSDHRHKTCILRFVGVHQRTDGAGGWRQLDLQPVFVQQPVRHHHDQPCGGPAPEVHWRLLLPTVRQTLPN